MTAPAGERRPLCPGCGGRLYPAATAGHDRTPDVYDRHPGCEKKTDRHLHLVKGARR